MSLPYACVRNQAHSLLEDLRAEVERKKEERRCGQQDDAAAAVGGPLLATTRAAVACISPSVHQLQLMWQRYQSQLVLALPAPR